MEFNLIFRSLSCYWIQFGRIPKSASHSTKSEYVFEYGRNSWRNFKSHVPISTFSVLQGEWWIKYWFFLSEKSPFNKDDSFTSGNNNRHRKWYSNSFYVCFENRKWSFDEHCKSFSNILHSFLNWLHKTNSFDNSICLALKIHKYLKIEVKGTFKLFSR